MNIQQNKNKKLKLFCALSSGMVATLIFALFLVIKEIRRSHIDANLPLAVVRTFIMWAKDFFVGFGWYGVAYLAVTSLLIAWLAKIWWVAEECRTFKYIVLSGAACFFWSVFGVAFCLIPIITYFIPDYIRII